MRIVARIIICDDKCASAGDVALPASAAQCFDAVGWAAGMASGL